MTLRESLNISKSPLKEDLKVLLPKVITVMADEITRSPAHTAGKDEDGIGYALRFPRSTGFIRFDKKPEDANSVKEIIEMFKQQKQVSVG
jgi:DNA ligase-1